MDSKLRHPNLRRAAPGAALLLLVAACVFLPGCANVEAWERGNLAKPQMNFERDPGQSALRSHAYSAREGGASGNSATGGGCGCY